MIINNFKIQGYDLAKTAAIQLCTGALLSKVFFPVVVKEGAVFCTVLGATTQLVEKGVFHKTSLEETLQNKVMVTLATLAALFFAAQKLLVGHLGGRIVAAFTTHVMVKLCLASFIVQTGLQVWDEFQDEIWDEYQNQKVITSMEDRCPKGSTSLITAVRSRDLKAVAILIDKGEKVDERDEQRKTALHWASMIGLEKMVEALLKGGAQVDEKDKKGRTALHIASWKGDHQVVGALLKGGAQVDEKDKKGRTALHMASQQGHVKVVEALLKGEAHVDRKGKSGLTALHMASRKGHAKIVETLLKGGANINATTSSGNSAMSLAVWYERNEVIDLLWKDRNSLRLKWQYYSTRLFSGNQSRA